MLVDSTGPSLPPGLITTSAGAGPYCVVQQFVGSKGVLLQVLPHVGGFGQAAPEDVFDVLLLAAPGPAASSGGAVTPSTRITIATNLRRSSGCISSVLPSVEPRRTPAPPRACSKRTSS